MASDDRSWPFSFVNLCEALRLDVAAIRMQVLDPALPSRVGTREPAFREMLSKRAA